MRFSDTAANMPQARAGLFDPRGRSWSAMADLLPVDAAAYGVRTTFSQPSAFSRKVR